MMSRFSKTASFAACLGVISLVSSALGQETVPRRYRVAVDSKLKVTTAKSPAAMDVKATASFDYTLTPVANDQVESKIDGIELMTQVNDQPKNVTRMNREGFYNTDGKEVNDIKFKDAPEQLQAVLAQFGAPLAVYTLGKEGETLGRPAMRIKNGVMIQTNAYMLARTFHVKFPKHENKWVLPTTLPLGDGQLSKGDLTFEKQGTPAPDGSILVKVSGQLGVTGKMGQATIDRGVYKVQGSQIYDPKLGDWTSGRYDIDMEISADDPRTGRMVGTGPVILTLKSLK